MAQQARAPARRRPSDEAHLEDLRRDRLQMLRSTLATEGYEGTVRLIYEGVGFVIALSPEPGVAENRLRHVLTTKLTDEPEDMLREARRLADLSRIACRRAEAIAAAGGQLTDPPAWAFLGHPVARGVYAAMGVDLATFRPRNMRIPMNDSSGMRISEFRIHVAAQRVHKANLTISVDAADSIARVRVLGGKWPDTLVDAMPGRPVGDILGLTGLERGTRAGDTPIGQVWSESGGIGFTVTCALEPMGTVPEDIDTGFLDEWSKTHFV